MTAATMLPSCLPFAESTIIAVSVWLFRDVVGATALKCASLELLKEVLHPRVIVQNGNSALALMTAMAESAKLARI